jgi:hypothetical protein
VCHGEDASANTSVELLRRMKVIKAIVSKYDSDDDFTMDETSFSLHVRAKSNVGY